MTDPATDANRAAEGGARPGRRRPPDPIPRSRTQWATRYGRSLIEWMRFRGPISRVERFCFFIGYARSGHTLVASLLDAHRDVVISNELDAFRYFEHGFRKRQVYGLILWHERLFSHEKRGFDYSVRGEHQREASHLQVIGDKRGAATGFRLAADPSLLEHTRHLVKVPIRVIQHARNPFDVIATNARVEAGPDAEPRLTEAIRWFGMWSNNLARIRPHLGPDELIETYHEELVSAPATVLSQLCTFIGVRADGPYLENCASSVWPSPRVSRHTVDWSEEQIDAVLEIISSHSWLNRYSFTGE